MAKADAQLRASGDKLLLAKSWAESCFSAPDQIHESMRNAATHCVLMETEVLVEGLLRVAPKYEHEWVEEFWCCHNALVFMLRQGVIYGDSELCTSFSRLSAGWPELRDSPYYSREAFAGTQ